MRKKSTKPSHCFSAHVWHSEKSRQKPLQLRSNAEFREIPGNLKEFRSLGWIAQDRGGGKLTLGQRIVSHTPALIIGKPQTCCTPKHSTDQTRGASSGVASEKQQPYEAAASEAQASAAAAKRAGDAVNFLNPQFA